MHDVSNTITFFISNLQESAVGEAKEFRRFTFFLRRGLVAKDSTGLSDPFVRIQYPNGTIQESETM